MKVRSLAPSCLASMRRLLLTSTPKRDNRCIAEWTLSVVRQNGRCAITPRQSSYRSAGNVATPGENGEAGLLLLVDTADLHSGRSREHIWLGAGHTYGNCIQIHGRAARVQRLP